MSEIDPERRKDRRGLRSHIRRAKESAEEKLGELRIAVDEAGLARLRDWVSQGYDFSRIGEGELRITETGLNCFMIEARWWTPGKVRKLRFHPKDGYVQIRASIAERGETMPVVVDLAFDDLKFTGADMSAKFRVLRADVENDGDALRWYERQAIWLGRKVVGKDLVRDKVEKEVARALGADRTDDGTLVLSKTISTGPLAGLLAKSQITLEGVRFEEGVAALQLAGPSLELLKALVRKAQKHSGERGQEPRAESADAEDAGDGT